MTEIEWNPELYKWEHIANILRERIADDTLPMGTVLSEVVFMQEFGTARATVRKAFAALRAEGLIVTRRGKGSVVVRKPAARGDVLD